MHLVVCTFCGLDERDAVHRVPLCLVGAVDLAAHLLGDGEACGIVRCAVDAETGRQLLHALRELHLRALKVAVGVERLDVRVDTKGHASSLKGTPGDFLSPGWRAAHVEPCAGRRRACSTCVGDTGGILDAPLQVPRVYSPRRSIGQSARNIEQFCLIDREEPQNTPNGGLRAGSERRGCPGSGLDRAAALRARLRAMARLWERSALRARLCRNDGLDELRTIRPPSEAARGCRWRCMTYATRRCTCRVMAVPNHSKGRSPEIRESRQVLARGIGGQVEAS